MSISIITDPETLHHITGIPSATGNKRCTTDLPTEALHRCYGVTKLYKEGRFFGPDKPIKASNITTVALKEGLEESVVWTIEADTSYKIVTSAHVNMPYNVIGYVYPRSSATRAHLSINCGIIDPGFCGTIIGLMRSSNGIVCIEKGFALLQLVLYKLDTSVEPYNGIYQE